jgi:predicted ATP-dependent serine protease
MAYTIRQQMDLRCQHCGELIIARSFGKCPGCYRDLPEDLQLSPKELQLEEMEETWRSMKQRRTQLGTIEIFPTVIFPTGKKLE